MAAAALAAYMVTMAGREDTSLQPPIVKETAGRATSVAETGTSDAMQTAEPAAATTTTSAPVDPSQSIQQTPTTPEPEDNNTRTQTIEIAEGDSFYLLMTRMGFGAGLVAEIMATGEVSQPLKRLKPGELLTLRSESGEFVSLTYYPGPLRELTVARIDGHLSAEEKHHDPEIRLTYAEGEIDSSLYVAAAAAGLEDRIIMALAEIFGWDIDFTLDLRQGDRFALLYEQQYLAGKLVGSGNVVAARLHNRSRLLQGIRHTTAAGTTSYYAPDGANLRKAFNRNPLPITRITSRFNPKRLHPVFKTVRPHRGVDYGAATGTPVRATGDGKVAFKGRKGGYGNVVILQHGQRYRTLYGHLNGFARGLRQGQPVNQGQTIGFVGQTGLATGPHLHYEFQVDGVHKDPLKVAFPHAEPIPGDELAGFLASAESLLAALNDRGRTLLADSTE